MTAEETVTNEETVYLSPPKNSDSVTSSSGGYSQRQSVAAEQVHPIGLSFVRVMRNMSWLITSLCFKIAESQ